jgi:primosomal protein N' (replication factor Y)
MRPSFAQVSINLPRVSGTFDYHLPEELRDQVVPGSLVVVPFGKQTVQGMVLRLSENSEVMQTRAVSSLLDSQPVLTSAQLKLAHWLSETTLIPLAACLDLMLPPGLAQQADTLYQINPQSPASEKAAGSTPFQEKLLGLLAERGSLRGRQLEAAFPHINWKDAARALVRHGVLIAQPVLPPPTVRPKLVRTVQLSCPPQTAREKLEELGRPGSSASQRRLAILDFLSKEPLPVDVTWVYAASGGSPQDLTRLAEAGLVQLSSAETWRDPLSNLTPAVDIPPVLTSGQRAVWTEILAGLQSAAAGQPVPPFLLHGVTGSGKTEIYLQAVAETLRAGRQVIILVPEIALTPQTAARFLARFPGQVGLVHSRLSPGERFDTWRRARAGQIPIIVGPRSALFTPLPNPGLLVVDECHDESYDQTETPPYYSTVQTAVEYGRIAGSLVLLGSATPGVSQVYQARQQGWRILDLPDRILAHRQSVTAHLNRLGLSLPASLSIEEDAASLSLPAVQVVDMRHELKNGNRSIFSRPLQAALEKTIQAGQQAILFLNRRGAATYVFCRDCGYNLLCPRCDLPLTLHLDAQGQGALTCHTCGYRRQMPKKCPSCGSTHIRQFGTGTEKVESEVQAFLPSARTLRWDAETARQKGSHDLLLAHFTNHQADILIGTQMLAKGLDLPFVTLVGVVLADVGLNLPDFRAGERTFQILTQVAGRAGRSPLGGRVILQTFQPEHYAIQNASRHDFSSFYEQELVYRRKMGYPPFSRLVRLEFRGPDSRVLETAARSAFQRLSHWIAQEGRSSTALVGPVPCFFSRQNNLYRWQIVVRGPDPVDFVRTHLAELTGDGVFIQVDPPNLL